MAPGGLANQLVEEYSPGDPASGASCDVHTDFMATCDIKQQSNPSCQTDQTAGADQRVQVPTSPPGVSNCYVFKSLLQEYAQKVGLPTPVYETIKEGPSHQPSFKSTVIVGGVRYDSLLGFLNRKAAEQSAAEIALMELSKCDDSKESTFVPVHETGLCKNLLQDYTQKMNYALPTYTCKRDDAPGKTLPFSCTVEIGGVRYIGAAAKTKKEAEIKAARTALLAIRSSTGVGSDNLSMKSQYTVVPPKRKAPDTTASQTTEKPKKKPKRPRLKKRQQNRRHPGNADEQIRPENTDVLAVNGDHGQTTQSLASPAQDFPEASIINQSYAEMSVIEGGSVPEAACLQQSDGNINSPVSSAPPKVANKEPNVGDTVSIVADSPPSQQMDASISVSGICQRDSDANGEPSVADVACTITDPPPMHLMDASDPGTGQGKPDVNREPNVTGFASIMTDPSASPKVANKEPNVGDTVSIVADSPPSQQMDASISVSGICQRESDANGEPSVADVTCTITDPPPMHLMDASDPGIGQGKPDVNREPNVTGFASIMTDPSPSQQMAVSILDTGVSWGQAAAALADTTNGRAEYNTAAVNVAPVTSDPPSSQGLESLVSEIGGGEPASTKAD